MAGVHPHTSLARPPLAWELGPAENCEQRGSRARRLAAPGHRAPSLAWRVLDDETGEDLRTLRGRSSLVRGRCRPGTTRRSGATESRAGLHPEGWDHGEPRLDLSRTPHVTRRRFGSSEPDTNLDRRVVDRHVRPSDGSLRTERSTASESRPAKDVTLVTIEVPSIRPDDEPVPGIAPRWARHRSRALLRRIEGVAPREPTPFRPCVPGALV